jgi:hypothetical protein
MSIQTAKIHGIVSNARRRRRLLSSVRARKDVVSTDPLRLISMTRVARCRHAGKAGASMARGWRGDGAGMTLNGDSSIQRRHAKPVPHQHLLGTLS